MENTSTADCHEGKMQNDVTYLRKVNIPNHETSMRYPGDIYYKQKSGKHAVKQFKKIYYYVEKKI